MNPEQMQDQFLVILLSPKCKQINAALLYSQMLLHKDSIDWQIIDQAIIDKWSESGLGKIKNMAWQIIEGSHLKFDNDMITISRTDLWIKVQGCGMSRPVFEAEFGKNDD